MYAARRVSPPGALSSERRGAVRSWWRIPAEWCAVVTGAAARDKSDSENLKKLQSAPVLYSRG